MGTSGSQVENLQRLLEVTRQMAATLDLTELLGTIIEATCEVLGCERATIYLYDRETNELYARVATGAESIRFPADRGIAGAAASGREVVNVPDAYADPRFNRDVDKQTGFRTRHLLTLPLENLTGELIGVLQALNKSTGPFGPEDEDLARVLSAQAGVALHRQALLDEHAEAERMTHDLDVARKIQRQLLPDANPVVEGYEIAGWNRSADETGGDCYDFIKLDNGRQAVLLADASGHGIGPALVIAQCRALVRALLATTDDLAAVCGRINQLLNDDLMSDRFVTAFIGILDGRRHRLDYASAGQGPLLFVSTAGSELRCATGLPLAITCELGYEVESFDFEPGAAAVLLTDGFYESESPSGELFGEQRVVDFVGASGDLPLDELILGLHEQVRLFSGDAPQADDLTAVLIRRRT